MFVPSRPHWIDDIMAQITEAELLRLFPEIAEFRRTGLLRSDSPVRALDSQFKAACHTEDSMLRQVEDALLYEMARRYNNELDQRSHSGEK